MNKSTLFKNSKIIISGHTGFKGSWLSLWLSELGANVIGISDKVPTDPAHYDLFKDIFKDDLRIDIKDTNQIVSKIAEIKPDLIFHLAAQPIVLDSYNDPINTFYTNTIGTANILEGLRISNHNCVAVMITSDKCYDNVEWKYGYRETDVLGGKDPYSGSKGAAELVIKSYFNSFFNKDDSNIRLGVGRAGNVIGGGDWASHRIVPDCVSLWSENKSPNVRSPYSTRPWQHVLEPLSGYLTLASKLQSNKNLNGEPFNFGPPANQNFTVEELVDEMILHWPNAKWKNSSTDNQFPNEAGLLKLNCDKALHGLGWQATLDFHETAKWTADWYREYYENGKEKAQKFSSKQITEFMQKADERNSFKID